MTHPLQNDPTSVLHFLWSGDIGGAERAVYQLAREQSRRGLTVGVAFGKGSGYYVDAFRQLGCTVIVFEASGAADLRCLPRARQAARRYAVHHFHTVEPLTFLASASSGAGIRVFTQRAGVQRGERARKRLRRQIARFMLQRWFHAWCGNSPYAAETLAETYHVPREAVEVVYNGIDFGLLEPRATRDEARKAYGIPAGSFVVGTVALLKQWKRIHLLLEAGAKIGGSDLILLIVGDGPDRRRLEQIADALGIRQSVVFTGMRDRVVECLLAMDAFVLPSNHVETFGNAVVEAMALGVPSTVFSDSPGIRGHIDPERTGFVVDDVDGLRTVLERLRRSPSLRDQIGAAGAAHVAATYSIARTAENYDDLYAAGASRRIKTQATARRRIFNR